MDEDLVTVSRRARRAIDFPNILLDAFHRQQSNPYNASKNPSGIVNLGTSENKLCFDLLKEKLQHYSGTEMPESHTHYSTFHGMLSFRQDLAVFLNYYMKPLKKFKGDDIYALNGCGSIIDILIYSLCDVGEGVLIPAPYYGGFNVDVSLRNESLCYPVNLSGTPRDDYGETRPFQLSIGRLQNALENARMDGVAIKGLLLANPNNPLGYIYTADEMRQYMEFASKNDLHLIADEIYMLSIFDPDSSMVSASAIETSLPKNKLHMVWGFSKDLGVSGFRCGALHTLNTAVGTCFKQLAYLKTVPATTQAMLQLLITDLHWLDNVFLPTVRSRLLQSYQIVERTLQSLKLSFVPSKAGFFVWVDFRDFIRPYTKEREMAFFGELIDHGVYIAPSQAFFGDEVGWMRIIFSVPENECKVAMQRLQAFLGGRSKL